MTDLLLWTDLETSGTDETKDHILEIACVITDSTPKLTELDSYEAAVQPSGASLALVRRNSDPYVQEMHDRSGLWTAIEDHGIEAWGAQAAVVALMAKHDDPGHFVLAGSGVSHFDRRFIARQMPELDNWLKYYCIDVGVLRRTLEIAGQPELISPAPAKPHRAMEDVRIHIGELRGMASRLGALMNIANEAAGRYLEP